MAAFLPFAVLLSLLVTGATAGGYGQSPTTPSTTPPPSTPKPSPPPPTPTPAPYTPTPSPPPPTPTPAPYTPTPAAPPPKPTPTPAPYTPTPATPPPATPTPTYNPQPATPSPPPKPAHGYDNDDDDEKKKQVVVHVEGLVMCQSCAKKDSQSLDGARPLPGAKVTVTCRDRKYSVMDEHRWGAVADSNGYFRAEFGVQHEDAYFGKDPHGVCFVRLHSSPDAECNIFTNINYDGMKGAPLRDEGKQWTDGSGNRHVVYAAGPLAFRPGPAKCAPPTNHY